MTKWIGALVIGLVSFPLIVDGQQSAFPGAEGGGAYAVGGRGGKVLEVTNLNDTGPGSLRDAVQSSGARTIVFRISGTIALGSALKITKDSVTIAGQTASGDGICLRKYPLVVSANHVIIRYLRLRLGDESGGEDDAFSGFTNDYTSFVNRANRHHIIVDHCSVSWSEDETLSFYGNDSATVQKCIISESLYNSNHPKGKHGYGGIWGGRYTSFHHNLLAHHDSRNPRFSGGLPTRSNGTVPSEYVDFRNNVIYNWGSNSSYGGESSSINIVANYYKPGTATKSTRNRIVEPYGPNNGGGGASLGRWYVADNFVDGSPAISSDNWAGGVQGIYATDSTVRALSPFPFSGVTTQTAVDAYYSVLADVGATLPRQDIVDTRILSEVRNGTVTYGGKTYGRDNMGGDTVHVFGILDSQTDVGGWPMLNSRTAPLDSDHDGMPDAWELAHGLNPGDPADRNTFAASGYTMLEEYLNSISGDTGIDFVAENLGGVADFKLNGNYPNPFNPGTRISYSIPKRGDVAVQIFNALGQQVRALVESYEEAGTHVVEWDGTDDHQQSVSTGVYLCVVLFERTHQVHKMMLLR
ncbi:MAG: FlgD immunoglobulin-like domain containing protein [Bacteroidota bacterium]